MIDRSQQGKGQSTKSNTESKRRHCNLDFRGWRALLQSKGAKPDNSVASKITFQYKCNPSDYRTNESYASVCKPDRLESTLQDSFDTHIKECSLICNYRPTRPIGLRQYHTMDKPCKSANSISPTQEQRYIYVGTRTIAQNLLISSLTTLLISASSAAGTPSLDANWSMAGFGERCQYFIRCLDRKMGSQLSLHCMSY